MNITELLISEEEALELIKECVQLSRNTYYKVNNMANELMDYITGTDFIMKFVSNESPDDKFQIDISSLNERFWLYVEVEKIIRRYFDISVEELENVNFDDIKPKEPLKHVSINEKMFVVVFDEEGVISKTKQIEYNKSLLE